jgi:periplasmic protein CpxP/Spy
MRSMIVIAAIASLAAGSAFAQYGAKQPAEPPAATQTKPATPSTPSAAAAMTETQAKARFEAQGYSNVSELKKDTHGMWTAKAMKDGKSHQLSLDTGGQVKQAN